MNLHYPSRACQNMLTAPYQKRSNIVSVRAVLPARLGKLCTFWVKFSHWFLRYALQADLRIMISLVCLSEWLLSTLRGRKTMSVISAMLLYSHVPKQSHSYVSSIGQKKNCDKIIHTQIFCPQVTSTLQAFVWMDRRYLLCKCLGFHS